VPVCAVAAPRAEEVGQFRRRWPAARSGVRRSASAVANRALEAGGSDEPRTGAVVAERSSDRRDDAEFAGAFVIGRLAMAKERVLRAEALPRRAVPVALVAPIGQRDPQVRSGLPKASSTSFLRR